MRPAILVPFLSASVALAQSVAFEGTELPESVGWTRRTVTCPGDRWLDGAGWFVQQTYIGRCQWPEQDSYERSFFPFAGSDSFFIEWRVMTDGPRSAIPWVAPCFLVAGGYATVLLHFTIAEDQWRFVDADANVHLFDIQPAVPHIFRLEIRNRAFVIHVDGDAVFEDVAPGEYPTADSLMSFGVQSPGETATTRWDYIRYGVIPDDAGAGDLNCDGTISQFDIVPFVDALVSADGYGQQHPACNRLLADTNADGSVNQFDILPFVDLLMP